MAPAADYAHDDDPDVLGSVLPRVLIVSRRTVRKNKLVDFVGEYHLDLIVRYGAVPVIVPRVSGIRSALKSFEPIHGVLLCEGEDVDPSLYQNHDDDSDSSLLSEAEMDEIRRVHASDTAIDREKDSIELTLAKLCVTKGIPFLGICRGSQVLNVACGGTLYQDIGKELTRKLIDQTVVVSHIDYGNYDGHRHPVRIEPGTPLHTWFSSDDDDDDDDDDSSILSDKNEIATIIMVNSYHHQGVKTLAARFSPMAHSPDGLIEGFYEPGHYNPDDGKFRVGLQFHPERMREAAVPGQEFDYPGCAYAYKEFVKAVIAFKRKSSSSLDTTTYSNTADWRTIPKTLKLNVEIEDNPGRRLILLRSFSVGKYLCTGTQDEVVSHSNNGRLIIEEDEPEKRARVLMEREDVVGAAGGTDWVLQGDGEDVCPSDDGEEEEKL